MNVTTRPLRLRPRREAVLIALYSLARPKPWGLGYPPSIREIMYETACGSTSTVWWDLEALWELSLVTHEWDADVSGTCASRAWRPNYDRVLFITQDGVTTAGERLHAAG